MSEEKQIAIQNLEKYIQEDVIYNGSRENLSDFDEFCINHCTDIQIVLELVKEQQEEIELLKEDVDGYRGLAKQIQEDYEQRLEDYYNEG